MWQNNGYGNGSHFHDTFNPDDFPPPPFAGLSPGLQQYFEQNSNPLKMMAFQNGDGSFVKTDFQPEMGLYNEGALQNQYSQPSVQLSPSNYNVSHTNIPSYHRPVTNISTRAAELKAQLLKGRERASSGTTLVGVAGQTTKAAGVAEIHSSIRGAQRTPVTAEPKQEQELNINELISQYADSRPTSEPSLKQEIKKGSTFPHPERPSSLPEPSAKLQSPSLGSPTKVTKSNNAKMVGNGLTSKILESRPNSNESLSEISEDETLKGTPTEASSPAYPKDTQHTLKPISFDEQTHRKSWDVQPLKPTQGRGPREDSPPSHTDTQPPRNREEPEQHKDRKSHTADYKNDRRPYPPDSGGIVEQRHDVADQNANYGKPEVKSAQSFENMSKSTDEANLPTLGQLLPHDRDLREWLEITGYHNVPYRDKILNRRRAIAALDAQRNALLAEMEAEERGGMQVNGGGPALASTMLPPPIPGKLGGPVEPSPKSENAAPQPQQRDRVVSNKRHYSDLQDVSEDGKTGKIPRIDDNRASRIKDEDDLNHRRPRSSGYDSSRHSVGDRRDERDPARPSPDESRGRGPRSSRSPGRREYDSRPPPPRARSYDGSDDMPSYETRDEWEERNRHDRDPRPFVVRGGYRGRAFDPNYRGRGRGGKARGGRGRGD